MRLFVFIVPFLLCLFCVRDLVWATSTGARFQTVRNEGPGDGQTTKREPL
jgi:hypothetical protein